MPSRNSMMFSAALALLHSCVTRQWVPTQTMIARQHRRSPLLMPTAAIPRLFQTLTVTGQLDWRFSDLRGRVRIK